MIVRTVLALTLAIAAVDPAGVAETEKFRAQHEADFRRDFVTLAGLFSLKDGANTIGSAASSNILLPKPAPAIVGRLMVTPIASGSSRRRTRQSRSATSRSPRRSISRPTSMAPQTSSPSAA